MPRKNYRWLEVKATKKIDEWRKINKIYLHWTAGQYDQLFSDYHIFGSTFGGAGRRQAD